MIRPYLIVSHDYNRVSAGVRALHDLAYELSTYYGDAFITGIPGPRTQTLQADEDTQRELIRDGIVVYPEVEDGNSLGAKRIVRYFLNIPGRIRKAEFTPGEVRFAYCGLLAEYIDYDPNRILTVPVVDTTWFNRNMSLRYEERMRWGRELYWKGQKCADPQLDLIPDTNWAKEITSGWPKSWDLLARMFKRARTFYSYTEYTALLTEARLCGCPCVVIPTGIWSREEYRAGVPYGMNGLAWGTEPAEIAQARFTVDKFTDDYDAGYADFERQMDNFVRITQEAFK